MKKVLKSYRSTILLLASIIIGGIAGLIFGEKATVVSPLGDIFINLLFIVIIPLVFTTIANAIIKMDNPKRFGKIMTRIVVTFIIMSVVSALIGIGATYAFKLVDKNADGVMGLLDNTVTIDNDVSILEKTANLLTVNDFNTLWSKNNVIAVLVFAIIFAFAVRMSKEKGKKVGEFIDNLNEVILNIVNIIMYYAPIGLGCYFAALIGTYGESIALGFVKTFVIYTLVCVFVYFVIYSVIVFIAGGKTGLKNYWKNIIAPTFTALATCSSSACIPVNVKATKSVGVSSDIAETTIPMGTSFHKDGSVIGSVFKIMFLVYLFNTSPSFITVLLVSLIATLMVTAVPIGGGTISEMLIITLMGFAPSALPILTIIATIIDAPATVLNVVGDTASSVVVGRMVDGKNFLNNKKKA